MTSRPPTASCSSSASRHCRAAAATTMASYGACSGQPSVPSPCTDVHVAVAEAVRARRPSPATAPRGARPSRPRRRDPATAPPRRSPSRCRPRAPARPARAPAPRPSAPRCRAARSSGPPRSAAACRRRRTRPARSGTNASRGTAAMARSTSTVAHAAAGDLAFDHLLAFLAAGFEVDHECTSLSAHSTPLPSEDCRTGAFCATRKHGPAPAPGVAPGMRFMGYHPDHRRGRLTFPASRGIAPRVRRRLLGAGRVPDFPCRSHSRPDVARLGRAAGDRRHGRDDRAGRRSAHRG